MLKGEIDGARLPADTAQMTVDSPVPTPIVFVPGVMGSRLKLGNDAWDPDSATGMLGWAARDPVDAAALLDIRGGNQATLMNEAIEWDDRLAEIWKIVDPKQQKDFYGNLRGWSGVAKDFYRDLLVRLEAFFNAYPFVPGAHPVYAFGYDWRKSNADSGKKLATRIDEILKKHPGSSKVVLVTHSMGGLVARHAVHAKGGNAAAKVKGVVHVVQPVNGAVQAYRRFAEGVDADRGGFFDFQAKVFAGILGGSWWGYTLLMSGTDGPLQLLPNQVYNGWLVHADESPVPAGNVYEYYTSGSVHSLTADLHPKLARKLGYHKIGDAEDPQEDSLEKLILHEGMPWDASEVEKTRAKRVLDKWSGYCQKLKTGLGNARDYHKLAAGTAHPRTFMLYAGDRKTEVGYDWSRGDGERLKYDDEGGDGTVPVASAKALDALVEKSWKGKRPAQLVPHRNTGAQEHSAVFADSAVVDQVELLTFFLIRLDKDPEEVPEECVVQSIDVECDHLKEGHKYKAPRKFKLKLPAAKGAKPPTSVLEIVAAGPGGADKVSTSISFAKPRCEKHVAHALMVTGPSFSKKLDAEKSEVDLIYGDVDIHGKLPGWLWPWNEKPVVYTLYPQACHSPAGAIVVRVYPAVEASISLEFALDTDDRATAKKELSAKAGRVETRGRPPHTAWKLEFAVKVKYGSRAVELKAEWEDKIKKLASVNLLVKRTIDTTSGYFFKYTGVTLLPVFPKLSLKYEGKFKEIEGSYRVGAEWSVMLKADPLIGLTVKVDIIKVLIRALGLVPGLLPLSQGLDKLRTLAEEHDQVFEISVSFSGTISGEVGGKKSAEALRPTFYGAITGKLRADFVAKAELGSKGVVGVALGAEVRAGTGVFAKLELTNDETGVFLCGKLGVLGCKFEYSAWASVKVFWEVKESYEGEFTLWEDTDCLKTPDVYLMKREK